MVYPMENMKQFYSICNSTLILRLLVMIPVIVVATIYLSHRIAGPLLRLEKGLIGVNAGDLTGRVMLRKNDDLKKVSDEFNKGISRLDNSLSAIKSYSAALRDSLSQIKREEIKEELKPQLDKAASTLEKISKELDNFKTGA
jgi:nitrogen fixation/metabolism regulation signal transduction histidine kinase